MQYFNMQFTPDEVKTIMRESETFANKILNYLPIQDDFEARAEKLVKDNELYSLEGAKKIVERFC